MSNLDLADLLGVRGKRIQWERPFLLVAALFVSDLVWLIIAPGWSHGTDTGYSLELFRFSSAVNWYAELLQDVVLAALAFTAFYLVKHPFGALATLAAGYAVVVRMVNVFLVSPVYGRFGGGFAESVLDPQAFIFSALWALFFFGSLILALRWIRMPWLALCVGAIVGSVLNSFIQRLLGWAAFGWDLDFGFTLHFLPFPFLSMALFGLAFWGGLRLTSDKSLVRTDDEARLPRGFYVGTLLVAYGIPFIVSVAVILFRQFKVWGPSDATASLFSLLIASFLLVYGVVIFCLLIYRMWAVIQDSHARTTPGKAVGFLFIPFFNLYWAFQALPGFATDYTRYVERYSLTNPKLPQGLFITYVILCFTAWIPVLGLILVAVNYFIGLTMISKICDAVNGLPEPLPHLVTATSPTAA
jgi:hypothetical protein